MHPQEVSLHVRSGRHAGAGVTLERQITTIGRGSDCDVVLSEPSVAERHMRVEVGSAGVAVTALEGAVSLAGLGEVEPGYRARLPAGAALELGSVSLELGFPTSGRAAAPVWTAGGVLAFATVGAISAGLWLGVAPGLAWTEARPAPVAAPPAVVAPPQTEAAAAQTAPSRPEPDAPAEAEEIAVEIASELERRGLEEVALEHGNGTFTLTGEVEAAELETFRAVERWFDESFPNLVLHADRVAVRAPAAVAEPPAIESAWHSGSPYIIVGGRRYHVADTLPSGWRLEGIDAAHADFVFDGRPYRVRLGTEGDDTRVASR